MAKMNRRLVSHDLRILQCYRLMVKTNTRVAHVLFERVDCVGNDNLEYIDQCNVFTDVFVGFFSTVRLP